MRRILVLLHRWVGLFMALFLFIAGLTGAIIAWDHEIDGWLNPQFFEAHDPGPARPVTELVAEFERDNPHAVVTYTPVALHEGESLSFFVMPRLDADNKPYELDYNNVSVDPASGRVLGKRNTLKISVARENLMSFIYRLHYCLHLSPPPGEGFDFGMTLMGLIAIAWTLDAFVALYISFPSRKVWRKSFAFRFREGAMKMNFDLHRSSGVWLWPVLAVFGVTAIAMNLGDEVLQPAVNVLSPLAPDPWDESHMKPPPYAEPKVSRAEALDIATKFGKERGIEAPVGSLITAFPWGFHMVSFHGPGMVHGDGGLGNPQVFIDLESGKIVDKKIPGEGSAGDVFVQLQFPLHSGRILGNTGRALVSVLGVIIAMLSFTGVWLWAKKRIAKGRAAARNRSTAPSASAVADSSV